MYFVLAKYKGAWIFDMTPNLIEADKWYHNQCTKLDGWGIQEVILIEGNIKGQKTEADVLKEKGYPKSI